MKKRFPTNRSSLHEAETGISTQGSCRKALSNSTFYTYLRKLLAEDMMDKVALLVASGRKF